MDHASHGLAQLPDYLDELAAGRMATAGLPDTISDPARRWCGTESGYRGYG
jgi:hypothetical protein